MLYYVYAMQYSLALNGGCLHWVVKTFTMPFKLFFIPSVLIPLGSMSLPPPFYVYLWIAPYKEELIPAEIIKELKQLTKLKGVYKCNLFW